MASMSTHKVKLQEDVEGQQHNPASGNDDRNARYLPSLSDIRKAAEAIQESWSDFERCKRAGLDPHTVDKWDPPSITLSSLDVPGSD